MYHARAAYRSALTIKTKLPAVPFGTGPVIDGTRSIVVTSRVSCLESAALPLAPRGRLKFVNDADTEAELEALRRSLKRGHDAASLSSKNETRMFGEVHHRLGYVLAEFSPLLKLSIQSLKVSNPTP